MIVNKVMILNELMRYKIFTAKADFARFLDISPQNLSKWFERNTFDIDIIVSKLPEINTSWLLTGEGEMLKNSSDTSTNNNELLASLKKTIELQEEHISLLKEMLVIKDAEINRLKKAMASAVPQTANVG